MAPQIFGQPDTGFRILRTFAGERHVGYHAEHVVAVFFVKGNCFLIVAGEHHLWAAAHTQHALMVVERFRGKFTTLCQQETINMWEHRRVESYRVLDDHYHLHAHVGNVVGVHLVFEQLDDGQ